MDARQVNDVRHFRPDKLAKTNLFETPRMFCDVYCLQPGQAQAPHAHADADKIYYVLEGEGLFLVGTEERSLGPGNAVLAPAGEDHGVRNASDGALRLLVFMAPNPNACFSDNPPGIERGFLLLGLRSPVSMPGETTGWQSCRLRRGRSWRRS